MVSAKGRLLRTRYTGSFGSRCTAMGSLARAQGPRAQQALSRPSIRSRRNAQRPTAATMHLAKSLTSLSRDDGRSNCWAKEGRPIESISVIGNRRRQF